MEDFPCDPPDEAQVGDAWVCPGCARKFYYILITFEDLPVAEAWYTDEIG